MFLPLFAANFPLWGYTKDGQTSRHRSPEHFPKLLRVLSHKFHGFSQTLLCTFRGISLCPALCSRNVCSKVGKTTSEVNTMSSTNFLRGMGMGLAVGAAMGVMMTPKRKHMMKKTAAGKAIRAVTDVMDELTDSMGL